MAAITLIGGSAMAFTVDNGTIKVGTSDLSWNQDASGYDYLLQYSRTADAYAQNGNTASPVLTGWANAQYETSHMSLMSTWDNHPYIGRTEDFSSVPGYSIRKVDLSATGATISKLWLSNVTSVWTDGGGQCSAAFYVSTDGSTWHLFDNPIANAQHPFEGTGDYYDVTNFVQGSNVYYVKSVVNPYWDGSKVEIARNGGYSAVQDKVWLTSVPEPGSMFAMCSGLLGLLGIGIRRRK